MSTSIRCSSKFRWAVTEQSKRPRESRRFLSLTTLDTSPDRLYKPTVVWQCKAIRKRYMFQRRNPMLVTLVGIIALTPLGSPLGSASQSDRLAISTQEDIGQDIALAPCKDE